MQRPTSELEAVRSATRRFLRTIDDLTDDQAHAPSRLPDWNRAEVVTHVARNADGMRGMVEGAARDEVVAMYPGGPQQRLGGIEAGRDEHAAFLLSDARHACDALADAWLKLPDDAWERIGIASKNRTMREFIWVRWREVELHHLDVDLGYEASDWPVGFVNGALAEIFGTFESRAAPARPSLEAAYRIAVTDHDRSWRIVLQGDQFDVREGDEGAVDSEVRGWGCDIAAWLYGRDTRGGGIVASGDLGALRLPQWFPFA